VKLCQHPFHTLVRCVVSRAEPTLLPGRNELCAFKACLRWSMAADKAELPLAYLTQTPKEAHTARVCMGSTYPAPYPAAALSQYGGGSMAHDCNGHMAMLCPLDNPYVILCMCVHDGLSCRLLLALPLSCG